jgi:crossover junction endodeoxyribonuclease RusA
LTDQQELFPLEFFIAETPLSLQASARSKQLWKATIAGAANIQVQQTVEWSFLDSRPVSVTIFFFCPAAMEGDVDNIVKPILDGMINVAYLDDRVVERVLVQKFEPGIEKSFIDVSQKLADALDTRAPVVYIRVDDDLRWRTL